MSSETHNQPVVLAIAGFDPSGGAGIIADIRTVNSFSCFSAAAITSITFQNSERFQGAIHQTADSVRAQIEAIVGEHEIAAVKIGMLPTAEVVREVARLIRVPALPAPVVDPVMASTSGGTLMSDEAFEAFVTVLMPLVKVITPNISEAEQFSGMNIRDEEEMCQAAARIRELGAPAVLVKGGHLKSEPRHAVDILDDNGEVTVFRDEWIDAPNVRGTGCMLSSSIACCLARGDELTQAVINAREYVAERIQNSQLNPEN